MNGAKPLLALYDFELDTDSLIFFHQLSQNLVQNLR